MEVGLRAVRRVCKSPMLGTIPPMKNSMRFEHEHEQLHFHVLPKGFVWCCIFADFLYKDYETPPNFTKIMQHLNRAVWLFHYTITPI